MGAFEDFLSDPISVQRWGNWLADLHPEDSAGNPIVAPGAVASGLRVSSRADHGFRTRPTDTPASEIWQPDLAPKNGGGGGLALDASLWGRRLGESEVEEGRPGGDDEFTIGGGSAPNEATLFIGNRGGQYDAYRPSAGARWDGRSCVVRFGRGHGDPGHPSFMPIADFRAFYFEMGEPAFGLGQVVVPLYGLDKRLDEPITRLRYRGTRGCIHFSSGAYASAGAPAKFDLTGAMTWAGWRRADDLASNHFPIGWQGGTRTPWRIRVTSAGKLGLVYTHSGGTAASRDTAGTPIVAGRWYHLAVTITAAGVLTLVTYDAITAAEAVETFSLAAATRDANVGGDFQLGVNGGGLTWVGMLDEDRIWNVARTLSEIQRARFGEIAVVPSSLVGYYKYNDGGGTKVTDSGSGTAADATLSGTTAWLHSLEGDDALAGRPKVDVHGRVDFQEAVLVDAATNTYQIVGTQAAASIQPHNGMDAITSGGADITSLKTFIETTPAAATVRTHLAGGYFKFGSQPDRPVTATCTIAGSTTKGGLIRKIITTRGSRPYADPGGLNTASFTQLDVDDPADHGIYVPDGAPIRSAVDALIGPGYWYGFDFDSQLFKVARWTGPAATADLVIPASRIIGAPEPAGALLRAWQITLRFARIRPHTEDEIVGAVKTNSPEVAQRGLSNEGWSLAPAEDSDILDAHPLARQHVFDTQYQYPVDAELLSDPMGRDAVAAEADRLLALFSSDWEAYEFKIDAFGLQIRLGDTVAPIVSTEDGKTTRLGFDGTRNMSVVAMSVDLENNVTIVCVG